MKYVTLGSCVLAVILVWAFAVPAQAIDCNRLTYLTFSAPFALSGVTLPAGTYRFSHPDCATDDDILRVSSQDGSKVYARPFWRSRKSGQCRATDRSWSSPKCPREHRKPSRHGSIRVKSLGIS
jgi:hypothetical protein